MYEIVIYLIKGDQQIYYTDLCVCVCVCVENMYVLMFVVDLILCNRVED
jgi:hypothetical protein